MFDFLGRLRGAAGLAMASTIAILAAVAPAHAQEQERQFNIPAQPLSSALLEFSRQADVPVTGATANLAGRMAPAVVGTFTPTEALARLLAGSGIQSTPRGDGGFVLAADNASPTPLGAASQTAPRGGATGEGATTEIIVVGSRSLNADIRRSEDATQPYVVFGRDEIERSGANNINDFLSRKLSSATNGSGSVSGQGSGEGFGSSISLRGLGPNQTLILVDGRRIADASQNGFFRQPDINGIPLAAIERIEVLPATASGIYGGSAVGGVINIVLRRDYSGAETRLSYANTFDTDVMQRRAEFSAGYTLEDGRTNVMFAAAFSDGNDLLAGDRDFTEHARAIQLANNPNSILGATTPLLGATTNIRSTTGANLTLTPPFGGGALGSPFTNVPIGYAGPGSDNGAALIANAGTYNLALANTAQSGGANANLFTVPTIQSANLTIRREFAPWLDGFLDIAASDDNGAYSRNDASTTFTLAAGAPGNPFNQAIRVTTPALGADTTFQASVTNYRAATGVIFDLPFEWRGEADYTWQQTKFATSSASSLNALAAMDVSSGALNVFRDTNAFSTDFGVYLNPPSTAESETTFQDIALRLSGPLPFTLPGGAPTLSLLAERRENEIGDSYSYFNGAPSLLFPSGSQNIDSFYAEALFPIVSPQSDVWGIHLLELQLAGRADQYTTVGASSVAVDASLNPLGPIVRAENAVESVDPTVGVRYQPTEDLMLRASWGTGFLPPTVNQLVTRQSTLSAATAAARNLTDPLRGNEPVGTVSGLQLFTGGRPDLRSEESESTSLGVVFTPRFIDGLRVSVDWVRIEKADAINALGSNQAAILQYLAIAPERLIRDPNPATWGAYGVGPIIGIDQTFLNASQQSIEAYDIALEYRYETSSFGEFSFDARATYVAESELQLSEVSPVEDRQGVLGSGAVFSSGLEWQGNTTLSWRRDGWTAAWTTSYFDSYFLNSAHSVDPNLGSARIPSQTYHDLFVSYEFGADTDGPMSGVELQFGVNNVFNSEPPIDPTGASFGRPYSGLGDARLANYYVSLRKSF